MVLALCSMLNSHMYQPKHAGCPSEDKLHPRDGQPPGSVAVDGPVTAATPNNDAALMGHLKLVPSTSLNVSNCDQQDEGRAESEQEIAELQANVTKLESEYSVLNGTLIESFRGLMVITNNIRCCTM